MSLDVAQYSRSTAREISKRIDASLAIATREPSALGEMWNLPTQHLSSTQISMARRCPEQYRQRYVLGRKEKPAEAPILGSGAHRTFQRNFGQKIQTGLDLDVADLVEWLRDKGWPDLLAGEQEKAGEEIVWKTSESETLSRCVSMVAAYMRLVAERVQPVAVEREFFIDMGLPVPVKGFIDLEQRQDSIDFKTGRQKRSKPKEDWRIQGAIYTTATGGRPLQLHTMSATEKTKAVSIVTPLESEALLLAPSKLELEAMQVSIRGVLAEVCMHMEMLGPDQPWPTHGRWSDWACDWCGFRSDCVAWKGVE